jgi:MFS family permease
MGEQRNVKHALNIVVIVAALGYFVDIYDLILFSIVRVDSLKSFGLSGQELTDTGVWLLNIQMIGMLLGGIVWGILGDKRGRLSVLFLTILLYSLANIANGMVQTLPQYYVMRFLAGLGLAGELGIGVTLVAEVMSKESRGYGTTIVSSIGIAGAVAGYFVTKLFDWRVAYYVGGGLGLVLLALRVSVYESGMFSKIKERPVRRGSFGSLFTDGKRLWKYLRCILIGVPVWYVIGILITLAPELAGKDVLNVAGVIDGKKAVMVHYIGASIGALLTGLISQWLRSRKKALIIALLSLVASLVWLFSARGVSADMFYIILFVVGIPNGFWSVFIMIASEQFGTNLRATVTTTVPNFVRGFTVILTTAFGLLAGTAEHPGSMSKLSAAALIGAVVMALALFSAFTIEETYHKELDYSEEI